VQEMKSTSLLQTQMRESSCALKKNERNEMVVERFARGRLLRRRTVFEKENFERKAKGCWIRGGHRS
jgi:hypothetical protein